MSRVLDLTKRHPDTVRLLSTFKRKIVGQEEATNALVDIVESYQAGFCDPNRPAGNALFLGPTGTGKTATVEALCLGLFGDERACIKIDCAEYQHGHEIAKLVGSPPGYLGHRETHPMLTQAALAKYHTERFQLSVILFDEIEKSSDTLWSLLLGILDKATLTTGTNDVVQFDKVILVMTSNLGAREMGIVTDGGIGYVPAQISIKDMDSKLEDIAVAAAKKKFTPEFYNRLDHVVTFKTLTEEQMAQVLNIELGKLQMRLMRDNGSKVKFYLHTLSSARKSLLIEGYDKKYGARHLRRAIERKIQLPLARLVASGQLLDRDVVIIEDTGEPEFRFSVQDIPTNGRLI